MTNATARPIQPPPASAPGPWATLKADWKAILVRTWKEADDDNVGLIAAGVAFYGFLSIVPLLGATVLVYGLVAEPKTVVANISALTAVMPADAARLIGEQLLTVVQTSEGKKGFGLLIALALALYGATKGAGSIVTALNIAYEEREDRGFIAKNLLTLGITAGAVLLALAAVASVAAVALLDTLMPWAPAIVLTAIRIASYLVLAGLGAAAAASLYRYGPDRAHATWAWLSPGSLIATAIWLVMTLGFGIYVANFGNYDATYGSLGAIVVLLTWLSLSAYVFLLGAELNSELERQTTVDTAVGAARPAGARGASAADDVPGTVEAKPDVAQSHDAWASIVGVSGIMAAAGLALLRSGRPLGLGVVAVAAFTAWSRRPGDEA